MLCLLKGVALECLGYLGIALTVSLTAHSQIHAHLATLTVEVIAQVIDHFLRNTLRFAVTNAMNGGIGGLTAFLELRELGGWGLADGTSFGCCIAFVDISTNGADEFLLHSS